MSEIDPFNQPSPEAIRRHEQYDANVEMLETAELGVVLERAYREAVKVDPRLGDIEVIPLDQESHKAAFARPSWHPEANGKSSIHIRLDNLDETLDRYQGYMDQIPGVREIFGEQLGVEPQLVTPQLLYVQSVLHEMGHLTEYMDYEDNPGELVKRNKQEKAALPIGNATVSAILDPSTPARKFVDDRWGDISQKLQVGSIDELAEMQHAAYRSTTSEKIADDFAAEVLQSNQMLKDELVMGNVEDIKNYPYAA